MVTRFESTFIEPIFLMRFFFEPDAAAVAELKQRIGASRRSSGKRVHILAAVGSEVAVPSAQARKEIKELFAQTRDDFHCVHNVFEGDSIKATLQRTMSEAAVFLSGTQRGIVFHHPTMELALRSIAKELNLLPDSLLNSARRLSFWR